MTEECNTLVVDDERVMPLVLKSFTTLPEIEALEGEMLAAFENYRPKVKHSFCKGVYAREITIPKGSLAIGHCHTEECLNIVVSGSVSVVLDGEVRKVSAPCTFVSPPGTRKVGYVHEELIWITVHPTNETSIEKLENDLIVKSDTFKKHEAALAISTTDGVACPADEFWADRLDFFAAIKELGYTPEQVAKMSNNEADMVPFEAGAGDLVYVATSKIHGNGMFAACDIMPWTKIAMARVGKKRTPAGRYVNHSKHPNCEYVATLDGDLYIMACTPLAAGEELTLDYRQARREALKADVNLTIYTQ